MLYCDRDKIEEDWRYVATVMDRTLLIVFSSICIVGQAIIILQAPALYDSQEPIDIRLSKLGPKIRPNFDKTALMMISKIRPL